MFIIIYKVDNFGFAIFQNFILFNGIKRKKKSNNDNGS